MTPQDVSKENDSQQANINNLEHDKNKSIYNDGYSESRNNSQSVDLNAYNRDVYGELTARPSRSGSAINERLLMERRTPDAYGRSASMSGYNKGKVGDYEDVYGLYGTENEYGKTYAKSPNPSQGRDAISIASSQQQDYAANYVSI